MSESILQFLWKFQLFSSIELISTSGEHIEVINPGMHNSNSGPDFLNARLKINDTVWAGNVEVHVKSSDWFAHKHQDDEAYNNVILHVVAYCDRLIVQKGREIPCIVVNQWNKAVSYYNDLMNSKLWVPCQERLSDIPEITIRSFLSRLAIERLESKSEDIIAHVESNHHFWEESFYQFIARGLGLKINSEPFEMLARSIPIQLLAKYKANLMQLEALLFGQSGLLNSDAQDDYLQALKKEYEFLKHKHQLKPLEKHIWKFFRVRPNSFPTIRISQFASLIYKHTHLLSACLEITELNQMYDMFAVKASSYWETHFDFGREAGKSAKAIGKSTIDVLLINSVLPFMFSYGKFQNNQKLQDKAIDFLTEIKAENNSIIRNWHNFNINAKTAIDSQGLIHLKNVYCTNRKCLNCTIGHQLISK